MGRRTKFVDSDILIIGGGFGGCGAAYESRYWGRDLKIVVVEKANIERSGAVAQGLSAINCYMGMQWGENQPEDFVRYARCFDLEEWLRAAEREVLEARAGRNYLDAMDLPGLKESLSWVSSQQAFLEVLNSLRA